MLRSRSLRWLVIAGAVLAGLFLVVLGFRLTMDVDPLDLGRLISDGPIKELRGELRPARPGGPRVILFAIDGVGDDAFREILSEGRIPELRGLLGAGDPQSDLWDHAWAPRRALSILPSTTFAAWTAVFTGSPVGETGVAGNEWYDRASGRFLAPAPVSISGHGDAVRVYSEGLMDDWVGVPTLFERADVRSYAALVAQHQGADILVQPDLAGTLDLILARESHGLDPAGPFRVWDGDSLRPVGDYLEANPRPDLLEFEERLRAMGEGPLGHRAGDILLLARMRIEDSTADRFYFSGPYRSWHGSPNAWDSQTLWVLARPGGFGSDARLQGVQLVGERPGQLDITPLVLGLLSVDGDPAPRARRSPSEDGLQKLVERP